MTSNAHRFAALGVVFLGLGAACHPHPKAPNPDRLVGRAGEAVDPKLLPDRNQVPVDPAYPPAPPTFPLATVAEHSVGPFLARRQDTAMAAYIGPGDGAARRIVALPVSGDGSPLDPTVLTTVSGDATMLVIRPAGGDAGAFLAAWTDLTDKGAALSVMGVTALGKARSPAIEIARTQDNIVWLEVVPTPRGEVLVWAEETKQGGANLFAVALDPDGRPRGLPAAILRDVIGWQALPAWTGAGVATVARKPGSKPGADPVTTISWLRIDQDAHPAGAAVAVATTRQRVVDVDAAQIGQEVVLAWTRRGAPEPEVMVASVDANGAVQTARSVSAKSGGAALVDVVGGEAGGALAWEETTRQARGARRLHVVAVPAGKLPDSAAPGTSSGGVLEVDTSGVPEVVTLAHGYGVLARLRTCPEPPVAKVACEDPPSAPTFIRLDERLNVTQTQPLLLDKAQNRASLGWGLSCQGEACLVLATSAAAPAEVRIVKIVPAPDRWRAPIPVPPPADAPRVLAVDTLATAEPFSELAVATVKGAPLLASLTIESASKAEGVVGSALTITPLDATGAVRGPAVAISHRGRPEGGVSVAAAEGAPVAALAWVGRENGHAAVHVTKLDAAGKRINDIQLTTAGGEASDVAVTWAGGGWVVAWVDTRDGTGEVYVTKLDLDLKRIAREVRVTNAPGDASDVVLLTQPGKDGPVVWVAWADPRDNPREGAADIFVARLRGSDATLLAPEQRVMASVPHSRSPALAPAEKGEGVSLAWIEEAPSGADPAGTNVYGAMIGALDDQGKLTEEPLHVRGAGEGYPTAIAIERTASGLHVAMVRGTRDDVSLDGMTVTPGVTPHPYFLFGIEGPPSMDVSLSLQGDGVYFADQTEAPAEGRVRRATIDWKR